jgi:glutaredoxin 3
MHLPDQPHVVVYVTNYCPYCHRAVALLRKKAVEFRTIDVSADRDARDWLFDNTGQSTVPQIFIGKHPIGGCDDMYALDRQGKLDPLLFPAGSGHSPTT